VSSAVSEQPQNSGQVITVWSAAGSPGRSCLVAAFACELAKTGTRILESLEKVQAEIARLTTELEALKAAQAEKPAEPTPVEGESEA
jgi:Mrp family chromosome partitioning ATPase